MRLKTIFALAAILVLSACGGKGGSTVSAPTTPPVVPAATIAITQQPASTTVTAGQPASFSVVAQASDGSALDYSWTLAGNSVGTNSATLTIPNVTTAMSGEQALVTVALAGDPVESSPATLIVTPAAPPPPGSSTPNPAFVELTSFPAISAAGQTYVSQPFATPVPAGLLTVCFYWPSSAAEIQAMRSAPDAQVVTDNVNDIFHFLFGVVPVGTVPGDAWCYGTKTAGGNIVVTVNTQTVNFFDFEGVVLSYTGDTGTVDQATTAGAPISNPGAQPAGTVVTNLGTELILSIATTDGVLASGNGFNSRFCAEPTGDQIAGGHPFCVEDAIGPATPVPSSVTPEFFINASSDDEYEAGTAGLY